MNRETEVTGAWRWVFAWVRLGRPIFLLGGFAAYGLGAAMACAGGYAFAPFRYVLGQVVVSSIQLMTHYSNDYFDYEADQSNEVTTRWSGGSRILQSGRVARPVALWTALACAVVSLIAMSALHSRGAGITDWGLMVSILILAWSYSAPPMRLHSRGIGELAAAVVVVGLVPWFGYCVQVGTITRLQILSVAPLLLIQFGMLLLVEVPDSSADARAGKLNLVARLGLVSTTYLHNFALISAYSILPFLAFAGVPRSALYGVACTLPLGLLQLFRTARGDLHQPRNWESMAFGAVALVLLATVTELVGFLLANR